MERQEQVLLRVEEIDKSFGTTHALKKVSFEIRSGRVYGLIGENGSGKSTVSSIIAGLLKQDSGTMEYLGKPYVPQSVIDANHQGICMIVQEQSTVETVSVAANIFLGKEDEFAKAGIVNGRYMVQQAQKALDAIGVKHIQAGTLTRRLSFEDRKLVEMARAIFQNPKILIVDETTTALSKSGRETLYRLMREHCDRGGAVIFISHELQEVMDKCDSVTVLRDGFLVATLEKEQFTETEIRNLMVGREIDDTYYRTDRLCQYSDEVILRAEHLHYERLKDISLELHKGEILGIGGLTECGMHELGKLLFGVMKPWSGEIFYGEHEPIRKPSDAIHHQIGYMSKNRDIEALMTNSSINENICLSAFSFIERFGYISNRKERKFSNHWAEQVNVKMASVDAPVSSLSGGNKQKVIFAKWLANETQVFLMDCPTRGIDIGVKSAIYQLMIRLKAENKSILMISEELPELLGMCDRILILKDGAINGEFYRDQAFSEQTLIGAII